MKKSDRVKIIRTRLNQLYPDPPIPLNHKDEYTLLIAVLLSAQSTDKKVNEITPALFKEADTPLKMQLIGEKKILSLIKQIGLSKRKAYQISELSKIITQKYNGKVPSNFSDLESLPGVGHKTASVVLSQAFGLPTFPVDTHIHRLAQRWGLSNGKNVIQTEKDLKSLFPKDEWNKLHLQIIFYAREYCTARGCDGRFCHICKELYPKRTKPVRWIKA